jgi:hypothetical protein
MSASDDANSRATAAARNRTTDDGTANDRTTDDRTTHNA